MSAQRLWIQSPLACFTANPCDASGGLVIENNRIVELLAQGQMPSTPVVSVPLFPWLKTLYPVWAKLTPKALELASKVALAELLLSGCTTAADHHYLFPTGMDEAIDIQVAAVRDMGMRAMLTRGSMSLGEDEGGLPPRHTVQSGDVILKDSERLVKRYHERGEGAQIQIALAPCSPFSVTQNIMADSAMLAKALDVRLHTHLAETLDEEAFCLKMFGMRTVDYLDSVGWLSDRTWLAHGIHFNQEEIERLGRAGTGVCHCPVSNMRLASGMCPTLDLQAAGAPVGLGVDGSASNDASNMMYEARQVLYLQRLKYGAERITPEVVLGWATRGSAALLGRSDIGEIAVGKQADLAMFKLDELRFSGSHDPIAALLLCGAEKAEHVMIGGQWRVKNGIIAGLDIQALMAEHKALAAKLVASA
ncbi:8-oxoguanine deaminase [Vibrio furnissii]|uniref:8-oxoguanine deaminase n=1 Tax=Vibrio furnissii TaxID=29494 RepID=A0A0Q2RVJ8_VIBFU|nr:8-oxoguanine deaminase [Vibrio furnissii]KQH88094.1 8-oxoguanine deaminase [Vibrio furnissii]